MYSLGRMMVFFLILAPLMGLAQEEAVRGKILEQTPEGALPLPGANVYWAGTTTGVATNPDGEFELPRVAETDLMVVSFIGYKADTVNVANRSEVTVTLQLSQELQEVDVVYERRGTEASLLDPEQSYKITEKELFKAACCNLSESFETNPAIDAAYTDAVTGTKQIKMLGLAGAYTQITRELIPFADGLNTNYGLTFIPGTWIESIQVSKGAGSVVNGYEGLTGQINVELKKPFSPEKLYLNLYGNQEGNFEGNLINTWKIGDKWSGANLLHGHYLPFKSDHNHDHFRDAPIGYQANLLHRWDYRSMEKGVEMQFGVNALQDKKEGGEMGFDPEQPIGFYGTLIDNQRLEVFFKRGKVFVDQPYKSTGLQLSASAHELDGRFGHVPFLASERKFFGNWIYQSIFGNTSHVYKTGLSFRYRDYSEQYRSILHEYDEIVPGAFFEYTYDNLEGLAVVAGLRGDYHDDHGFFFTPRAHMRYLLGEKTSLRVSGGRSFRVPSVLAENTALMATSRDLLILEKIEPEIAWNGGLSLTHDFRFNFRNGTFAVDFYRTQFENKLVVDLYQSAGTALFYNLEGQSFANSFQTQMDYELFDNFDVRLAYRWYDVRSTFSGELKEQPFVANHRAFINAGYETGDHWLFDATLSWFGTKPLPYTGDNPEVYQLPERSDAYFLLNAQITKRWANGLDVYAGVENILDYKQPNAIVAADDPFGPYFDSSMIWGPLFGRMAYAGLRYKLFRE